MGRDYGAELDVLRNEVSELHNMIRQIINQDSKKPAGIESIASVHGDEFGMLYYSGHYRGEKSRYQWEPQERKVGDLLRLDGDRAGKILSAIGHKQRIDILRAVLQEPLTGSELVERLNMGTTGQLYHHIKALLGANLLIQEDRGGRYTVPSPRILPLLLLLAATSDLLETSDYIDMSEARNNVGTYLGNSGDEYDPHHLLWAVVENSILEFKEGYCTEVNIILHRNGGITIADNGRGIPVSALSETGASPVKAVFTDMSRFNRSASFLVPGAEMGIKIPIVNALSDRLSVEIRREGKQFRQDFKHGVPQTDLLIVGVTKETGTSVTFKPSAEIFHSRFDPMVISGQAAEIIGVYPGLKIDVLGSQVG